MQSKTLVTSELEQTFDTPIANGEAVAVSSIPTPPSNGDGWPALEARIKDKIAQTMALQGLVGMTVAISQNGRLVFSKGYGYARKNNTTVKHMTRSMRTPIGSTTKALITGPITYEVLQNKGLDPRDTTVYGERGIFEGKYAEDYGLALKRFNHVVDMAMDPDGMTYTWFTNGTVCKGVSRNLTESFEPRPFKSPEGKTPEDIRGMAITNDGKVYTWCNDGSSCVGTPTDLEYYEKIRRNGEGAIVRTRLPKGLTMYNVVGIAMAPDNYSCVYYDDGTMSSGISTDFTTVFENRPYRTPGQWMRYHMLGVAIAPDAQVYSWYAFGKTLTGTQTDLDRYRPFADFNAPEPEPTRNPYHAITVQHLFDHTSGFYGGSSYEHAATMFGKADEDLSFAEFHKYFLRTRPLRWFPGSTFSYSNFGFSLLSEIIQTLSGRSYRDYAINTYLQRLGLKGLVRPLSSNVDSNDATLYRSHEGHVTELPFTDTRYGISAGGWSATAESLIKITKYLTETYSWAELDQMGWFSNAKNSLSHSGAIAGGLTRVIMFPPGYISFGGLDLSNIHVAITTNTSTGRKREGEESGSTAIERLANEITIEVPVSGIPSDYSI